ncbi:MAG: O-antigen ligase family protein [Acidobacteriota bacterium]
MTSTPPSRRAAPLAQRVGLAAAIATIVWGALAFGAVYPWAYWPLIALALTAAGAGLLTDRASLQTPGGHARRSGGPGLIGALTVVAVVVALQLVPMPLTALRALNPNAIGLLQRLDPAFVFNPRAHALSVWPADTAIALVLFVSFAALLLGTVRLMAVAGAGLLVEMLIVSGVVLALIGIVQKPLYTGKIYGFWITQQGGSPFGPFVNRNHFAGWMLMVFPIALGYLFAGLARGMRGVRPGLRNRFLWLSSPDANKLAMAAMGIGVMALALVLTMSRSGIGALALSLAITGWFALRRLPGRPRKVMAGGYLVLLAALLVGWVGVETLVARFSQPDWSEFNGRRSAWSDATAVFGRHWLTGTGLNTYQVVNVFYQPAGRENFTSAAHNDYVQLAAEGGLLLILPVAACMLLLTREVRRRFAEDGESSAYWLRAGAVTGLLAIALQETVEFSLQIPGNAALFAVVCAIAIHKPPARSAAR